MLTRLQTVEGALSEMLGNIEAAIPDILTGLIFLLVAGAAVRVVQWLVRKSMRRVFRQDLIYAQFVATVVALFLWFGVALTFLTLVGLDQIALALGTASGFLALGVSYAVSGMIADAVSGVYLLRDPDFNPGDRVDVGGTVGTVEEIELRKTRLSVADGLMVRGNAEIEKKWTKIEPSE
ncbi:MAG: mechanosensitive ion channel domain-containing protein [Halobacteriaceae archaeon]